MADDSKTINGKRYIRAEIAEEWRRQRDMMAKYISDIHQQVHEAKRAYRGCAPPPVRGD